MNLTEEELNNLCRGCGEESTRDICWVQKLSSIWPTVCPCSECLIKPMCQDICEPTNIWMIWVKVKREKEREKRGGIMK
jgi:hypothetical protein